MLLNTTIIFPAILGVKVGMFAFCYYNKVLEIINLERVGLAHGCRDSVCDWVSPLFGASGRGNGWL